MLKTVFPASVLICATLAFAQPSVAPDEAVLMFNANEISHHSFLPRDSDGSGTFVFNIAGGALNCIQTSYNVVSRFGDYYRSVNEQTTYTLSSSLLRSTESSGVDGNVSNAYTFEYNGEGELKSMTATAGEGGNIELEYDGEGRLLSVTVTDAADGDIESKVIYSYRDNVRTVSCYDSDGALTMRAIQTLDGEGGPVQEETVYNGDGTFNLKRVYTYTRQNDLSDIEWFDEAGTAFKRLSFVYDDNNFISEVRVFLDGEVTERHIYKTDSNGNPTRISFYTVSEKFGGLYNELYHMEEFTYDY